MSVPWTPSFGTYHGWAGDQLVLATVDRNAGAGADAGSHPVCCRIGLRMLDPLPNGTWSPAEAPALDALEARLGAELQRTCDAWFVGRYCTAGLATFAYYLVEQPSAPVNLTTGWEPYALDPALERDPQWTFYAGFLAPTPIQQLLIDSNHQRQVRAAAGDRAERTRPVTHTALFEDPAAARRAAVVLHEAGFTVEQIVPTDADTALVLRRDDALLAADTERFLVEIVGCVEPHGGRYDGWAAPIVKD